MIGPDWAGEPNNKQRAQAQSASNHLRIAVVTGTRAEFGLLIPVIDAIQAHPSLESLVIAAGSHLVSPALTFRDVRGRYEVADSIPMQVAGRVGRLEDAQSLGRGVSRFARSFELLGPDWVLVLGDRIEAFAAASAASIGGIPVAHMHGGDIAEGVADEAMRHAITKLAHLHLPATPGAARRIRAMGEPEDRIHMVGSPAIDGLAGIPELDGAGARELGDPEVLVLFHGVGRADEVEEAAACAIAEAFRGRRLLWLAPNLDPGRGGILRGIEASGARTLEHMPRDRFVGLLKRLARTGGIMVGNSSSALIEAQAIGVPAVNIGPRQSGRERGGGVVDTSSESPSAIGQAVEVALSIDRTSIAHPFGDGEAGGRTAGVLALVGRASSSVLRKRSEFSDA